MLKKCSTKTARVKGITFHPSLHFLIASLHSGEIQLWNYLNSTLVEVFEYHEGPVRGIDFHLLQPLFVSGGDDTHVVVWDFRQKKMLFALKGHTDYVRTVQFHPNYPWILSASDDQTIRIWNWQGRSCISVLQGHTHYVMCARFHPKEDLLVSASLDQTARIWDVTVLREKNCAIQTIDDASANSNGLSDIQMFTVGGLPSRTSEHSKLHEKLVFTDVLCLYNMCGHEKGVNWAIFHNAMPCVITASDDKTIRVWRYNGPNIWQTNILRGHKDNICSLIMHPNNINYMISVSEDKTIKVWDTRKWFLAYTYTSKENRFWIVQQSKNSNYIATGHDSGFIVFKLFKERPIVTLVGNTLYYIWNGILYSSNLDKEIETTDQEANKGFARQNLSECDICYDEDGISGGTCSGGLLDGNEFQSMGELVFRSPAAVFSKRYRKRILALSGVVDCSVVAQSVMAALVTYSPMPTNLKGNRDLIWPFAIYYNHYCPDKSLFLVNYVFKKQHIYEVLKRGASSEYNPQDNNTVLMGEAMSACFASRSLVVAINMSHDVVLHNLEGGPVSSICVEGNVDKVFPICSGIVLFWSKEQKMLSIYNIECQEEVYKVRVFVDKLFNVFVSPSKKLIAAVFRNKVLIYDRKLEKLASAEVHGKIKTAAWYENSAVIYATDERMYYIMVNGDCGVLQSIDAPIYIVRIKNTSLHVMKRDHRCYRIEINSDEFFFKVALYYKKVDTAKKLIEAGRIHGNAMVAYLINKNYPSLARMIITDPMMKLEVALKFGDIEEALEDAHVIDDVETWENVGNAAMEQGNCVVAEAAYQKAKLFDKLSMLYLITGNSAKLKKMLNLCKFRNDITSTIQNAIYLGDMTELSNVLKNTKHAKLSQICENTYGINIEDGNGQENPDASYMVPPIPITRLVGEDANWKVLATESKLDEQVFYDDCDPSEVDQVSTWVEPTIATKSDVNADVWGSIDEIESAESMEVYESEREAAVDTGPPIGLSPLDYINMGESEVALDLLEKNFGLRDKTLLLDIVEQAQQYAQGSSHESNNIPGHPYGIRPINPILNDDYVHTIMNKGYTNVTAGLFQDAVVEFRLALKHWIFLVTEASREYIEQCRIYITAMLLEDEREKLSDVDMRRSLELAVYFACCNLLPQHQYLVMRRTMGIMWKAQNYITAKKLITRLLSLDVSNIDGAEDEMQKAKRIYALCEKKGVETYALDCDEGEYNDLNICTISFVKIRSQPTVQCRFCGAVALDKYLGHTCNICQLCSLIR
ncbi:Coatomer WD associated region family protein [Babesia bovis T2Bo]|uniref:WD domain, G-beta repeat domain containing protein n=1 Tax=Babesia bovis TaxID=5865 RepID=A7APR7_BABBO|nr:Coatomer WD associated region family protein [Babesia bovis T2Bo]EDO08551.1 Coatomer WD associated region family protein [Babesia bovis T2Bo]|eukprot:XP_001612119.1 WD domain, G-beta repeat domain containing protein [Babesia bovis T2Bo]